MVGYWQRLSPLAQGRLLILTAAILWSTSGAFVKTSSSPAVSIATYRSLAAGLMLMILTRWRRVPLSWEPKMIWMLASFSTMNYFFIASMTRTTAANAIFLQYSAPIWIFLASTFLLHEPVSKSNLRALLGAMLGIAILIAGEWSMEQTGVLFGLVSGFSYAGVAVTLRYLRRHDSLWLASLNHCCAGASLLTAMVISCLAGTLDWEALNLQPKSDFAYLALFGTCQMALPYVFFGMGLRSVPVQEAALLTLAEPVLNPVWTYLAAGELPSRPTLIGGGILLLMLVLRYVPQPGRQRAHGEQQA